MLLRCTSSVLICPCVACTQCRCVSPKPGMGLLICLSHKPQCMVVHPNLLEMHSALPSRNRNKNLEGKKIKLRRKENVKETKKHSSTLMPLHLSLGWTVSEIKTWSTINQRMSKLHYETKMIMFKRIPRFLCLIEFFCCNWKTWTQYFLPIYLT